ncbi:MAG: hypothetical protein ACI90V_006601 [Bacillariaceae sp.]
MKVLVKVPHLLEEVLHRALNLLWLARRMVFCQQGEEFSQVSRVLDKALAVLLLARRLLNFNGNPKLKRTKESRITTAEVEDIYNTQLGDCGLAGRKSKKDLLPLN